MMMLSEICQDLRNWFERDKRFGTFTIENNTLVEDIGLQAGQYFRIVGSIFNDGVHQYGAEEEMQAESFDGAIWLLAIPQEVVAIAKEIEDWTDANCKADSQNMSPFNSESFGGYSYSKGQSTMSGGAVSGADWRGAFGTRLNKWRKI